MREFIALAKQKPGTLNYGSAGTGSINHLALELLNVRAGINIVHVPYRGIADATKDLLAGNIQAMTASIPATLPQVAAKKNEGAGRDRDRSASRNCRTCRAGRRKACPTPT